MERYPTFFIGECEIPPSAEVTKMPSGCRGDVIYKKGYSFRLFLKMERNDEMRSHLANLPQLFTQLLTDEDTIVTNDEEKSLLVEIWAMAFAREFLDRELYPTPDQIEKVLFNYPEKLAFWIVQLFAGKIILSLNTRVREHIRNTWSVASFEWVRSHIA